jgi:2',3'-cyclic-nucleotide 2'-phosphodiesterase (5'-nucleotidase family)
MPAEPVPDTDVDLTLNGQEVRAVIQNGITNDQVYYVWVIAVNAKGNSPPSERVSAETHAKPALDRDNASFKIGEATERFINEDQDNGDRLSRKKETALGDLVCDGAAWYAREVLKDPVDFAYINGGIITNGMGKGDITVGTIKGILPYNEDQLTILTMKGTSVQELFNFAAKVRHGGGGGSGTGAWGMVSKEVRYILDYTDRDTSDALLKDLTIHGVELDPQKDYRIATSSYLYDGGDGYWMFIEQGTSVKKTGLPISAVVIDYIYARTCPWFPRLTDG